MTTPVCRFVVSACLAGEFCRYDGGSNACAAVREPVSYTHLTLPTSAYV